MRTEASVLAQALYRVGDVVVTIDSVPVYTVGGGRDGGALPGWKWRVTRVYARETANGGYSLRYAVVAHTAPLMYHTVLRPKQITRKLADDELAKSGGSVAAASVTVLHAEEPTDAR